MAKDEVNVIDHLLDVEKGAAQLVSDAQVEASKRVATSRSVADADYKKKYTALVNSLEKDYEDKVSESKKNYEKVFETYKSVLQQTEKDVKSFNSLLDSILFSA